MRLRVINWDNIIGYKSSTVRVMTDIRVRSLHLGGGSAYVTIKSTPATNISNIVNDEELNAVIVNVSISYEARLHSYQWTIRQCRMR